MCDVHSQSLPSSHAHTAKSLLLYVKVFTYIYTAPFPKTSFVIKVVTWTVHNGQLTFAIDQWKSPFYILLSLLRWLMIAWWVVKLGYLAVLLVFVFSCKMWRQKKKKVTDAWNGVEVRNACSYTCVFALKVQLSRPASVGTVWADQMSCTIDPKYHHIERL